MKLYKEALRVWIAVASIFSFLIGWALLAHSPKPIQPANTSITNFAPLPTIPSIIQLFGGSGQNGSGLSPYIPNTQAGTGIPLFRTGGS